MKKFALVIVATSLVFSLQHPLLGTTYQQLPNTELPPDTSPPTSSFTWKGTSFTTLNDLSSNPTAVVSINTGTIGITPASSSVNGTFPVPINNSGTNLLYRGFAQTNLATGIPSWVRLYVITSPDPIEVTNDGSATGYYDSDFLIYSKEASGAALTENGFYIGPSYSFPATGNPSEFTTLNTGSLAIATTGTALEANTPTTLSRDTSSKYVLTATTRSPSGISTFAWAPEATNMEVQPGIVNTANTYAGLGANLLLLAQGAQYTDPSTNPPTPAVAANQAAYIGNFLTGSGAGTGFNRDVNAGGLYQSYGATPTLINSSGTTTLTTGCYYQYINNPSNSNPAGYLTGGTVTVPSGTLLEFSGNLTMTTGILNGNGTVLFSGTSDTITLTSASTFSPTLLMIEANTVALSSSSGTATPNPDSFDLMAGSTLRIGSNVVLTTTPGTTWNGYGVANAIPAVPATSIISGNGTLHLNTPLSTVSTNRWSSYGTISPTTLILDASSANTTFVNQGYFIPGTLSIPFEPYTYHIIANTDVTPTNLNVYGPLTLDSGTLSFSSGTITSIFTNETGNFISSESLTMDNTATTSVSLINSGEATLNLLNLLPGGSDPYQINPGLNLEVTTLNQGSSLTGADLDLIGIGTSAVVSNWNTTGNSNLSATSSVQIENFNVNQGALSLTGNSSTFTINNALTVASGSSFTWDNNVLLELGGVVTATGGTITGTSGSQLNIISDLTLASSNITADILMASNIVEVTGTGTLTGIASLTVLPNAYLSLTPGITLVSNPGVTIQGTLIGPGFITSSSGISVAAGGTIGPGNSSGEELVITGNLNLEPNAFLTSYVNVNNNTSATILVDGDATLNGSIILELASNDVRHGQTWGLITANNFLGTLSSITPSQPLPGYSLISFIDPETLFVEVEFTRPLADGVGCGNPLSSANSLQTIFSNNCANQELSSFLINNLFPALSAAITPPTQIYSCLSGAEYAAIDEAWAETQLQSIVPLQRFLWDAPWSKTTCSKTTKHNKITVSGMGSAIYGGNTHCGSGRWSGANGSATAIYARSNCGSNSLVIGLQDQWLQNTSKNAAKGHAQLNSLEAILGATMCFTKTSFDIYSSLLIGAGGGNGHIKRHVNFDSFTATPKGNFSLITFKGQFEAGIQGQYKALQGQGFITAGGAGTRRGHITEHSSSIALNSPSTLFGAVRAGPGGRLGISYLTKRARTMSTDLSILGYWQGQFGGKNIEMHFSNASCSSSTQHAQGLSPFGAVIQGNVGCIFASGIGANLLFNTDLSRHIQTYGGQFALSMNW